MASGPFSITPGLRAGIALIALILSSAMRISSINVSGGADAAPSRNVIWHDDGSRPPGGVNPPCLRRCDKRNPPAVLSARNQRCSIKQPCRNCRGLPSLGSAVTVARITCPGDGACRRPSLRLAGIPSRSALIRSRSGKTRATRTATTAPGRGVSSKALSLKKAISLPWSSTAARRS